MPRQLTLTVPATSCPVTLSASASSPVHTDAVRTSAHQEDGDAAVRVFTDHGWRWGGYWRTPKDYQHFERRDQ
jgi:hypothetical protein